MESDIHSIVDRDRALIYGEWHSFHSWSGLIYGEWHSFHSWSGQSNVSLRAGCWRRRGQRLWRKGAMRLGCSMLSIPRKDHFRQSWWYVNMCVCVYAWVDGMWICVCVCVCMRELMICVCACFICMCMRPACYMYMYVCSSVCLLCICPVCVLCACVCVVCMGECVYAFLVYDQGAPILLQYYARDNEMWIFDRYSNLYPTEEYSQCKDWFQ